MTTETKRSTYFNALELEVLMLAYGEYEHIFRRRCNTAAAAKERETQRRTLLPESTRAILQRRKTDDQSQLHGMQYAGVVGVGAVDGTHIQIIAPSKDEDVFVNRKNVHSINTQIVFDATFYILDVAKWPAGSTRDPRILMGSGLRQLFERHNNGNRMAATYTDPPPPPLTESEELALSQNRGRPVAEGIPGGSSSEPVAPQDTIVDGVICLVQPPTETTEEEEEDDEMRKHCLLPQGEIRMGLLNPSILDVGRDGMVIRRVIDLYGRVLLSSNNCNIMENNTCHNDVTCPLWGDPELLQALEPGFEYPYGHLNLGSSPAVGHIQTLLRPRLRGQGKGSTKRAGMDSHDPPAGSHQTLL
ncbi:putative nuclease HARBI1 [Merluccius polli]|uniref:Nuclease HARBI1 n=1 Tax=Merluccius polli TaxID=89951 RepID=A0AA47NZG3_MERPO|nr:putative nuclease HARBI1 [Merluccius polli]